MELSRRNFEKRLVSLPKRVSIKGLLFQNFEKDQKEDSRERSSSFKNPKGHIPKRRAMERNVKGKARAYPHSLSLDPRPDLYPLSAKESLTFSLSRNFQRNCVKLQGRATLACCGGGLRLAEAFRAARHLSAGVSRSSLCPIRWGNTCLCEKFQ